MQGVKAVVLGWGEVEGGVFSRPGEALICPLATDLLGHTERAPVTAED